MLEGLRNKLSLIKLQKVKRSTHGLEILRSMGEIDRVGFLIGGAVEQPFEFLMTFCQQLELEGKQYAICTYNDAKELPSFLVARPGVSVIQARDTNWLFEPKREAISDFTQQRFDYLVELTTQNISPLLWVKQATKSRLRIGYNPTCPLGDDLSFSMQEGSTIEAQIKALNEYV